jgi:hypothetical protein
MVICNSFLVRFRFSPQEAHKAPLSPGQMNVIQFLIEYSHLVGVLDKSLVTIRDLWCAPNQFCARRNTNDGAGRYLSDGMLYMHCCKERFIYSTLGQDN